MYDLIKAKEILLNNNYTCVLVHNDTVHTLSERGVKPLFTLLEEKCDVRSFSAADKVIGRATAFLYVLLGVKAVYARVISKSALEILKQFGITAEYDTITEYIINRQGDGICPFELATLEVVDAKEAYEVIRKKLAM